MSVAAGYVAERVAFGTILSSNWTACPIEWPNTKYTRPGPSVPPAGPNRYLAWDRSYTDAQWITMNRDGEVKGFVDHVIWQEGDTGDEGIDELRDELEAIYAAVAPGSITFLKPIPGNAYTDGSWYGRHVAVPFVRFGGLTSAEIATMAGVGSTSRTISQAGHGFAVKDWIAFTGSAWAKAQAVAGNPRCDGVVSLVVDADTFVLTATGAVTLRAHGYTPGPLYLSQGTPGAVVSALPASGIVQQVAVAISADDLIVQQLPEVER